MALKVKFRTQFPANVSVTSPITLTKVGSSYTFGFNGDAAPTGPAGPTGATGASGAGYGGTSATSLLIANTVTKVFTTQSGLAYQIGNYVRASSASAPANFMEGNVSGYSGTSLSIDIKNIGGSGTFTDWAFSISGSPGSVGVSTINGATGAVVNYYAPQGRITLASGVPVMATSQAGATTIYYTPYAGNMVPIYDGTNMTPTVVAEVSQATTDATKSPLAVAASKIYDLFVWNDAGTIRCTRGPAWTNATTRGYTFTMVSGILLNTSSITNGPAASRGTWVGTIASNASSTIDWILGAAASGGVAAVLNVWNAYNRVNVSTTVNDSGSTYNYTSATVRQCRASVGNQISFVVGASEDGIHTTYKSFSNTTAANAFIRNGIGYDTNTAFSNNYFFLSSYASITFSCFSDHEATPAVGTHTIYALEQGDGTNANSFGNGGFSFLTLRIRA